MKIAGLKNHYAVNIDHKISSSHSINTIDLLSTHHAPCGILNLAKIIQLIDCRPTQQPLLFLCERNPKLWGEDLFLKG